MKDTTGPAHPLPLKPSGTKRKLAETKQPAPSTPAPKVAAKLNGHSPMSTASITSRRSTASTISRRGDEVMNDLPVREREAGDVFVFGAGSMGELGLGATSKDRNVKRPRLNAHLRGNGIVDVAVGGMHVAALDHDGKVWTWGVNDQGSLGRDTKTAVPKDINMKDDASDSDSDDEEDLNPLESTPGLVDGFPEGVKVVKLACGDSISVAIADDGKVYSWGTFRVRFRCSPYSVLIIRRQMDCWDIPNQVRLHRNLQLSPHSRHSRYVRSHVERTTYWLSA
jgi:alpha-tubulin suppressor-like RCC1 family protein